MAMILLGYQPINKGPLLGKAAIELPSGLQISDIAIFRKDGRCWVSLPSEQMRDRNGQPMLDDRGKVRYRSSIRWKTRELGDAFSDAVIALIERENGPLVEPCQNSVLN